MTGLFRNNVEKEREFSQDCRKHYVSAAFSIVGLVWFVREGGDDYSIPIQLFKLFCCCCFSLALKFITVTI
jgi:hypothetical protein